MADDGAEWFYVVGSDRKGPFSTAEMGAFGRSGAIGRDTLVWSASMAGWQPLGETALAGQMNRPPEPPAPPAMPAGPAPSFMRPQQAVGFTAAGPVPRPIVAGPSSTMAAAPVPQPAQAPAAFAAGPPSYGAAPTQYGAAPNQYGAGPAYGAQPIPYGAAADTPDFLQAIKICFVKYATFKGRASRPEFWFFNLFSLLFLFATGLLNTYVLAPLLAPSVARLFNTTFTDLPLGEERMAAVMLVFVLAYSLIQLALMLVLMLPALAVLVRRLHDTDRSGWYYWMMLIPLVGPIIVLVRLCQAGSPGRNRFG